MNYFIQFIAVFVKAVIDIWLLLFLARAVCSWIFFGDDNKITNVITALTEPLIMPVRILFEKFGWFAESPLDVPFFVTVMILVTVSMFL